MIKFLVDTKNLEDRLDCFGQYDANDTICKTWCALNIRCAIARNEHLRSQILEDLEDFVSDSVCIQ